jgi:hypothetical protein
MQRRNNCHRIHTARLGRRASTRESRSGRAPLTSRAVCPIKSQLEESAKTPKVALDLGRNRAELGVQMKSDELRGAVEELAIKKRCDETKDRQALPKKSERDYILGLWS